MAGACSVCAVTVHVSPQNASVAVRGRLMTVVVVVVAQRAAELLFLPWAASLLSSPPPPPPSPPQSLALYVVDDTSVWQIRPSRPSWTREYPLDGNRRSFWLPLCSLPAEKKGEGVGGRG